MSAPQETYQMSSHRVLRVGLHVSTRGTPRLTRGIAASHTWDTTTLRVGRCVSRWDSTTLRVGRRVSRLG